MTGTVANKVSLLARYVSTVKTLKVQEKSFQAFLSLFECNRVEKRTKVQKLSTPQTLIWPPCLSPMVRNGNVLSGLVRRAAGSTGVGTTVQFVYDAEGKPFLLRLNGKTDYFYLYNGLGDVTGLVDRSNQVVVRYQYNSWGKVTSTQDTSGVSLATLNPFCYRKYVYDSETGLYCLGSRYYDPEVGRFVNADDTDVIFAKPQELYHKNLYVYCDNNPVVRRDL